ncbi:hypothetical protein KP509_18G017300 [Ceratopteris richardii]|uniref:HMA domain-containing protein n=1 Tax=Ceratopteris richardii TaxID=49495 RepID=A0A8T2SPG9_CERRI|nr:hypothetical protein KP509_18G017300 [Ceratopteris richardii]
MEQTQRRRRWSLLCPSTNRGDGFCTGRFPKDHHQNVIQPQQQQGDTIAVLRVTLHCPACVRDVTRSLQCVHGVTEVAADATTKLVTVKGWQLDANRLCKAVRKKTRKRCEILLLSALSEELLHILQRLSNGLPAVQTQAYDAAVSQPPPEQTPPPANQDGVVVAQQASTGAIVAVDTGAIQVAGPQNVEVAVENVSSNAVPMSASPPQGTQQHLPCIEIKQQTHAMVYGSAGHDWTSHLVSVPPYQLQTWGYMFDPPQMDCYMDAYGCHLRRYEELINDENPNSCAVM